MPSAKIHIGHKVREDFDALVARGAPDACWPWRGTSPVFATGKGADAVRMPAQRMAWIIANGKMPGADRVVGPTCATAGCCNPAHLAAAPAIRAAPPTRSRPGLLGVTGTAHPRSLYDEQQRAKAVQHYKIDRWPQTRIARELGCHRQSVARWLAEAAAEMLE